MDITPYEIVYLNDGTLSPAEVRPCCRENNVVDYAIYINNQLSFNITKLNEPDERWIVSLKNADKNLADDIIQNIGSKIDQHNKNKINTWK